MHVHPPTARKDPVALTDSQLNSWDKNGYLAMRV